MKRNRKSVADVMAESYVFPASCLPKKMFLSHSNPAYDLAPLSANIERSPALWRRKFASATKCSVTGHKWYGTGYANAHKYSWHQWEIGHYHSCRRCGIRMFDNLKTQDQLEEVLRIERDRWQKYWEEWAQDRISQAACC